MQSQAPPRVRLCIAPVALSELWKQAMYLMERFFYIPDFAWALSYTIPQIVVAVVILVVALRLMREPKDEETEDTDEEAEEADEQERRSHCGRRKQRAISIAPIKAEETSKNGFLPFFNTI